MYEQVEQVEQDERILGTSTLLETFIKHMKYDKAELNEVEAQSLINRMLGLVILPNAAREKRILHEGMLLLNRCIQELGAGDGPTSEGIRFLERTNWLRAHRNSDSGKVIFGEIFSTN